MKTWRWALAIAGALLVILAVWRIQSAEEGLLITRLVGAGSVSTAVTHQETN